MSTGEQPGSGPDGHKVKTFADYLNEASAKKTFDNMQKLASQNEYEIPKGSGIKYKRKMLTPTMRIQLEKLQNEIINDDPEKRMENLKQQAMICLEGLSDEKWEDTDSVLMEIVVGACLVASKGFCDV